MNITMARLKGVEHELKRIADLLELYMIEVHGIRTRPTPTPAKDESDITYATNEATFIQELRDLDKHRNPERPITVEEEDET